MVNNPKIRDYYVMWNYKKKKKRKEKKRKFKFNLNVEKAHLEVKKFISKSPPKLLNLAFKTCSRS